MIWCNPLMFAQAQFLTLHQDAHCYVWLKLAHGEKYFRSRQFIVTSAFTDSLFQADRNLTISLLSVIEEEPNSSTKLCRSGKVEF